MAKEKRATWWKMFYHQRAAIESVNNEDAGAGLKAAFRYFDGEDISPDSLTAQAFTVFCVIRPYIDESFQDYNSCIENGKRGAKNRWGSNSPPIDPHSPPIGCLREAEADADILSSLDDREKRESGADKPRRPRFVPPTVEEVAEYVRSRGSGVDPQGFIDFYEAKGWLIGKTPMKDWKAACRNAESWERWKKPAQQQPPPPRRTGRLVTDENGEEVVVFD